MSRQPLRLLLFGLGLSLVTGCGKDTFKALPDCDGRHLIVSARRPVAGGQADVYLFDYDGNGFHLMPNLNDAQLSDLNPTLSADGRFVAFEREMGPGDTDILVYDRCQDLLLPQPGLNSVYSEGQPAFSANGLRLAFARDTLGWSRLRLYDGSADRLIPLPALSAGAYADSAPSINTNGTVIAFVSTRNGNPDVFVYDVAGDSLRDLPDLRSPQSDIDPCLTPDGQFLVFASDRTGGAGGYDLYLYDLTLKAFVAVSAELDSPQNERAPSINGTSDRIVFQSDRPGGIGGYDLWLYTRSSGHAERLGSSSPFNDVQPCIVWF
jgi:Tol biopolymer transport system component